VPLRDGGGVIRVLLADGQALFLGEATVKTHVARVLTKLASGTGCRP
jgi:hypothetical protein